MKKFLFAAALLAVAPVFAATLQSKTITVNPARITDRVVLASTNGNNGVLVQIIAEHLNGTTDVSNTHRIILAISQIGEMTEKETSFEIGKSMGLISAKRLSGGVYQVRYQDADLQNTWFDMEVIQTIDARDAVMQVRDAFCAEFTVCKIRSAVSVQTKDAMGVSIDRHH